MIDGRKREITEIRNKIANLIKELEIITDEEHSALNNTANDDAEDIIDSLFDIIDDFRFAVEDLDDLMDEF